MLVVKYTSTLLRGKIDILEANYSNFLSDVNYLFSNSHLR